MKSRHVFQVSDKVVCVEAIKCRSYFRPCPQVVRIYVVRKVLPCSDGTYGLHLVGVRGRKVLGEEVGLHPRRFRLLADAKTRGGGKRHPSPKDQVLRVISANWLSAGRDAELGQMEADAIDLIRAGRDGEAFALICKTLRHDCPIRWLLFIRRLVSQGWISADLGRKQQP